MISMKGQFFIISTVIIISAMFLIAQYLIDYGKIDLKSIEDNRYGSYVSSSKSVFIGTLNASTCERYGSDFNSTCEFLKDQLIEKGIKLECKYSMVGCTMNMNFNLSSTNFRSETSFSYP